MNCETFQTILQDLAMDSSVDLRTRQDGLAHAEGCPECAARLKDECRLVAGLGALAASFADAEASSKIEEALLKAFRDRTIKQEVEEVRAGSQVMQILPNQSSANNSPFTRPSGTLSPGERAVIKKEILSPRPQPKRGEVGEGARALARSMDSKGSSSFWNAWPVRIAAVLLLVVGLAAWFSWQTSRHKPEDVVDQLRSAVPEGRSQVSPPKALPRETAAVPKVARAHPLKADSGHRTTRKPAVQADRSQSTVRQSGPSKPAVEGYVALDQTEIATEFLPISYGDPAWSSVEGGQLVRVQLPRTTLLSFGFPMSEERSPEPIKAEVLLGEDGMARAIRFVH
jgi:hypothetical protein